ncbi:hypothetical protein QTI66_26135 [Variovorax sp. J22R133]|uniref:hypothetical protein n=1 Tax=Variovorax brevis TaxID=3053503 RepID=UPI0025787969|nr:hypothetical protein [Variovorax sp. J22R133]MDM0115656.1 hypothetical protein [Variovorax sp. J22R133]
MEFHPEHLFDTNQGENVVWDALKKAFRDAPGSAFYRYAIVDANRFARYEPDVLLALHLRSPAILECKGCRIEHIESIAGSDWSMREEWHRRSEHPAVQARDQSIELRRMFQSRGIQDVTVQSLVALPFVSKNDWSARGFDVQASTAGILFAEDFEDPLRLRKLIEQWLAKRAIDATTHRQMMEVLGGHPVEVEVVVPLPVPESARGEIKILRYRGRPPSGEDILKLVGVNAGTPYTYLVATAALERDRRREGIGGQHQLMKDLRKDAPHPEEMQLLFWKSLRYFIGRPVLRRSEQLLMLQRAIRAVAGQDKRMADQLHHDVFAWRDVFVELEEAGEAEAAEIIKDETNWSHPSLRKVAGALRAAYQKESQVSAPGTSSFEDVAGRYLESGYLPTPVVILEGFTRLTTLQRRFIQHCAGRAGCQLWVIQPFDEAQARGFAAIHRTYVTLALQTTIVDCDSDPVSIEPALNHVQRGLFASEAEPAGFVGDDSVQLRVFPHSNDEVSACVDAVLRALDDPVDRRAVHELAVVCADAPAMTDLLREEASRRGREELFALPPRQLLLTPVGRFALTLYEAWANADLHLDPEQFATLLASGWLGGQAQRSVEQFEAVAAQQFTHCRSRSDWLEAFSRIRAQRATEEQIGQAATRLPASRLDEKQLKQWQEVIQTVHQLCSRLFKPGERPLGAHITQLLDEIEQLDPHSILVTEREVLARIREALAELVEARSVGVDAHEFGQLLSGMIHERQEDEDGELGGATGPMNQGRVWVVGPEGIDNVTRHTVFFLGVDDRRMPAPGVPPWPRVQWSAGEHIERQRYRFLAVVRAARHRLWLSCSRHDWERDYRPSPYLEEVARLLEGSAHLEQDGAGSRSSPANAPEAACAPRPPAVGIVRSEYELDELAVYRLCPHRFKLESLNDWARCYESDWQLQWSARGVWLSMILHQVSVDPTDQEESDVGERLESALALVKPMVQARFAGLSTLAWITIENDVRNSVQYLLQPAGRDQLPLGSILPGLEGSKEIAIDDRRSVTVRTRPDYRQMRGRYLWLLAQTNQSSLWLQHGKKDVEPSEGTDDGTEVFRRLYEAVDWWRTLTNKVASSHMLSAVDKNELLDTILRVEAGHFPKNPGEHCEYCPVQRGCMGMKS